MAAPTVVGSIIAIDSSDQTGSQSITVPAGADLCLLCAAYYDDAATGGINTASLNGSSLHRLRKYLTLLIMVALQFGD
ncbi:MAG: hypothetical protein HC874_30480 [Richelia sp. SL_2_1]|nr:hypothetical protein [Richelia sp. SL_2_1]